MFLFLFLQPRQVLHIHTCTCTVIHACTSVQHVRLEFCTLYSLILLMSHVHMYLIFPDLLEESPFLKMTLPWGELSNLQLSHRSHSDDGPILWVRPGEQLIPTGEIGGTPRKRKM